MQLRKHQLECIDKINKHFQNENKGLIKMFCGSGKSFIIYNCLLKYADKLSVIVVPSINLITQFNKDYLINEELKNYNNNTYNINYELLSVCSKNELDKNNKLNFTTDSNKILEFINKENYKIILITYQSLDILTKLIIDNNKKLDLLCFDESHHILGDNMKKILFDKIEIDENNEEEDYYDNDYIIKDDNKDTNNDEKVEDIIIDDDLDNELELEDDNNFINLFSNKTLFFTATPKNSNGIVMFDPINFITLDDNIEYNLDDDINSNDIYIDNTKLDCGDLIFEYMHIDGVNDGILNDFNIRIDLFTDKKDDTIFEAISRSILETGNNRVLTFHSRSETKSDIGSNVISFSNSENKNKFIDSFNKVLNSEYPTLKNKYKNIEFKGITANTKDKTKILDEFDKTSDNNIYILASCKTIGEGVDTKNANMVVFIDSKQSYIEIIQNIGRVCRKNENTKNNSTILIPAYVDVNKYKNCKTIEEKDKVIRDEMSKSGDFSCIMNVLSALRQEDPYMFELCLKSPNLYTEKEIKNHLNKNKLEYDNKEYKIEELFNEYKVKYNNKKTELDNFDKLSKTIKKRIQIITNKVDEKEIIINEKYQETEYILKKDNKYSKIINKDNNNKVIDKINRNVKPSVHISDNIKVLWEIDNDINLNNKIFGGYIKSKIIGASVDDWINNLNNLKEYINKNKKRPSYKNKNNTITIKKLSKWEQHQQYNYKKKIEIMKNDFIYNEWNKFITEYKKYFMSNKKEWYIMLNKVKKYMNINKKKPSQYDKNKKIKQFGGWIVRQQTNYNKKKQIMKNNIIYNEWTNFITEYKQYFMSNEEIWFNILYKVIEYINNNKKRPSSEDKNKNIKQLGKWISEQQQKYKKKIEIMKNEVIYNTWTKFITEYRIYFISNEELWYNILNKLKEYINTNKKRPSESDKNKNIKQLGQWISDQQKKYKKKEHIMKNEVIYNEWAKFKTEYIDNIDNLDNKKLVKKSTTIKLNDNDNDNDNKNKESEKDKKARILSEYQELSKKMSMQNSTNTNILFKEKPDLWHKYHDNRDFSFLGYDKQDEIPVNKIINYLQTKSNNKLKILDLGCGRNLIKTHFKDNKKLDITGYDHVSFNDSIACDISKLPDEDESVDICVYSQSLMGSNWKDYINEGFRVLRYNGEMIISESIERYDIIKSYIEELKYCVIKSDYMEKNRWFYYHIINNKS